MHLQNLALRKASSLMMANWILLKVGKILKPQVLFRHCFGFAFAFMGADLFFIFFFSFSVSASLAQANTSLLILITGLDCDCFLHVSCKSLLPLLYTLWYSIFQRYSFPISFIVAMSVQFFGFLRLSYISVLSVPKLYEFMPCPQFWSRKVVYINIRISFNLL